MKTSNAELVVSKGELYFNRFAPDSTIGEGELYIGNTPGFSVQRSIKTLDRATSYNGQQVNLESYIVSENHKGKLVTDNMSIENLALWFGGEPDYVGQTGLSYVTEVIRVRQGRWYQLGTSYIPYGVRHVKHDLEVYNGDNRIDVDSNLIMNLTEGRFTLLENAPEVSDKDELTFTFQWRSSPSKSVVGGNREILGSLRFISTAPVGTQFSYYFPCVSLLANGTLDLKSDDWQTLTFDMEVRRLNPATEFYYAFEHAEGEYTLDEYAILTQGGVSLSRFPSLEDQFNEIINVTMLEGNYGQ